MIHIIIDRDMVWTTFDGRHIKIRDLEDTHVANLIDYLSHRRLSRDGELITFLKKEAKLRGLKEGFLERAQIPHKDSEGNWMIWDHARGPKIVGTPVAT